MIISDRKLLGSRIRKRLRMQLTRTVYVCRIPPCMTILRIAQEGQSYAIILSARGEHRCFCQQVSSVMARLGANNDTSCTTWISASVFRILRKNPTTKLRILLRNEWIWKPPQNLSHVFSCFGITSMDSFSRLFRHFHHLTEKQHFFTAPRGQRSSW